MRALCATAVVAGTLAYLAYVFRLADGPFRTTGLGDWIDPYFINALMEHWWYSARTFSSPASPPMFYPAPHALGYSHGLILFAPFYLAFRAFLHPFPAYTFMLFAVMAAGSLSLYALLRKLKLSFGEAIVLTAAFLMSPNVTNGMTAVWTQRASVFLIPPILLLALHSARMRGRSGAAMAFLAGLLAGTMYVQDFYTAHLAALLAGWFGLAYLTVERGGEVRASVAAFYGSQSPRARIALVIAAIVLAAAVAIFLSGGFAGRPFGIRVSFRDWRRPALLALVIAGVVAWRHRPLAAATRAAIAQPWRRSLLAGVIAGVSLFLWIYLPAFREHPSFPAEEAWNALATRDPFPSYRSFVLAGALAGLAWLPWFRVDRTARLYAAWLVAGSAFVLLAALKFGDHALWTALIVKLPGFDVIRDPKRIVYLYELSVALAIAFPLARSGSRSFRAVVLALALVLLVTNPNRERFDYGRPVAVYDRWVASPTAIDPECQSFYIKRASQEYLARSPNASALYGIDATFVALRTRIPTLNGYSAWAPEHWELGYPDEASYAGRLEAWISRNHLTGVCELDVERRSMLPASRR